MRSCLRVVAACVLAASLLALVGSSAAGVSWSTSARVNTDPTVLADQFADYHNDRAVGLDGSRVVWVENGDVLTKDLATGIESAVTTGAGVYGSAPDDPQISCDVVVWTDWAHLPGGHVWTRNLTTGITSAVTSGDGTQFEPVVSKTATATWVAWLDGDGFGYGDVWARRLPSGSPTQVTTGSIAEELSISGTRLVWRDHRNDTPAGQTSNAIRGQIWTATLPSGEATKAVTNGFPYDPRVSGDKIVYLQNMLDPSISTDVWVKDLTHGTEREFLLPGVQDDPEISGDLLTWRDTGANTTDTEIVTYDMAKNQQRRITATGSSKVRPVISSTATSTYVIWRDEAVDPAHAGTVWGRMGLMYARSPSWAILPVAPNLVASIQEMPSISDRYVTWVDGRFQMDIFAKDLVTGREFQATHNALALWPVVSGSTLVVPSGHGVSDGFTAIDLSTGATESVFATGYAVYPAISGNKVVWIGENADDDTDVFVHDVQTHVTSAVTSDAAGQWTPAIDGSLVAWRDDRNGNYDIYAEDLASHVETAVCSDPATQTSPAVSGSRVVWVDSRNGSDDIYAKDLGTGVESAICTATGDQEAPQISGEYVVWQDKRTGVDQIWLGNVFSGESAPIDPTGSPQMAPQICGRRVVWTDYREPQPYRAFGDANVYLASFDLPPCNPPTPTVAVPARASDVSASSAVPVTWSARDASAGVGVSGYDVQVRAGAGGAWTPWLTSMSGLSALYPGVPGATYYFRVRANELGGGSGRWGQSAACVVPYDQNVLAYKPGWKSATNGSAYRGGTKYQSAVNASARAKFTGALSAGLVVTTRADGGSARIYVNDKPVRRISLYSKATVYRVFVPVVSWATPHTATLRVVVESAKPRGSSGRRVEIDGVAVAR